jgi:ribonucleoside-triphosphate reductase
MIKIELIDEREDVFDITVEGNHNFFADGLLVHNCAEISLRPFQFCNLTTIHAGDVESQDDLNERAKAAAFIGTLQASYTNFHYLRDIWKRTTEKEALIGVSMTGIASGEVLKLDMKQAANIVKEENQRVAALIGTNPAARCTTVKPEGTSSLVLGTSSGIHAWHNDHYIRRIRVGKNESIYTYLTINHPELVKDEFFKPTIQAVIEVPQKAPEGAITRQENALDLLKRVSKVWKEWVKPGHRKGANKNNVSTTITIKPHEWQEVGEWMWANRDNFTALSVLPYDGGSYIQAPFEDITQEQYEEMVKVLHSINLDDVFEISDTTSLQGEVACGGGACEVT